MIRKWFLDGEEVPFQKIIREARKYGYGEGEEILLTSEASKVLEENGHDVKFEEIRETKE